MAERHFIMLIERWERIRTTAGPLSTNQGIGFGNAIARARVAMAEEICEDLRVLVRLLQMESNPLARLVVAPGEGQGDYRNDSTDEHLLLTPDQAEHLARLRREAEVARARELVAEADAQAEAERIRKEQALR